MHACRKAGWVTPRAPGRHGAAIMKVLHLLLFPLFAALFFFTDSAFAQDTFQYSGYLESDSVRSASMNISVSGTNVTGSVTLKPVCQSNARLPGAEFTLSGSVNGQWEGKGSISGTWKGVVRWCDKDENRSGSFTVSMGQGAVYFSAIGSYYNRYVFPPLGKVHDPGASAGTGGPPGASPGSIIIYEPGGLASLGPPRKGFKSGVVDVPGWGDELISRTIEMKVNETQTITPGDTGREIGSKGRTGRLSDCKDPDFYVDGAVRETKRSGKSITVWAAEEGVGRLYARTYCRIDFPDGESGPSLVKAVYLILVGDRAVEDYTGKKTPEKSPGYIAPAPDIARAVIRGKVVMVRTKQPVGNAQLSLISSQGGAYYRDSWKSNASGGFNITAENMLISGVYEVMAQKMYAEDMGTRENPSTVEKDLWPIKKYFITVTKETAQQGVISVGEIEMDTVDNIFNKGSGRDASENRDSVKQEPKPTPQAKDAKQPQGGYNPLSDPNLQSPGTSPKTTDIASADKLGGEFQEGQGRSGKSDQGQQQAPISQPDSYTGRGEKKDEGLQKAPSPPGYPPYDYPAGDDAAAAGDYRGAPNSWRGDRTVSVCDDSQKRSAYNAGLKCGRSASTNKGQMSSECLSASTTYKNMDRRMGWGSCLYNAFDEGYRAGLFVTTEVKGDTRQGTTTGSVTAELQNKAGENVHIFIEGQDSFGPQNKLGPGQKRSITLNLPPQGGTVKFAAGRNGQILARCSWTGNPKSSGSAALVTFSGSNSLTCTTK